MAADTATENKAPSEWATGDEPMTPGQSKALTSMCERAGVDFNPDWTKAQASEKIDELAASLPPRNDKPSERAYDWYTTLCTERGETPKARDALTPKGCSEEIDRLKDLPKVVAA